MWSICFLQSLTNSKMRNKKCIVVAIVVGVVVAITILSWSVYEFGFKSQSSLVSPDSIQSSTHTQSPSFIHSTLSPTLRPTFTPTAIPSMNPTVRPTVNPSLSPTLTPTLNPTITPTFTPTAVPSMNPTVRPTITPTVTPTLNPTIRPTFTPTAIPSMNPTIRPTFTPTVAPTIRPSLSPTAIPSMNPTIRPTFNPTVAPTAISSMNPTIRPTFYPTVTQTAIPSMNPTVKPTFAPTVKPTISLEELYIAQLFDSNENGYIEKNEYDIKIIIVYGSIDSYHDELFNSFDLDQDQVLAFDEFISLFYKSAEKTEQEMLEALDSFEFLDTNGDGSIDTNELGAYARSVGKNPTEAELMDLIQSIDMDGDLTQVSFTEFVKWSSPRVTLDTAVRKFIKVDLNLNRWIEPDELSSFVIAYYDQNQDGVLSVDEFFIMFKAEDANFSLWPF